MDVLLCEAAADVTNQTILATVVDTITPKPLLQRSAGALIASLLPLLAL